MTSLPHPVPSRMSHNLAVLFGHEDDTLIAWQCACTQAAEALRPQHESERLAKALALAQDGHVVLEDDGSATVQGSGPQPYALRDGRCNCPDAQQRGLPCKHALAVQIHQQAAALLLPSTAPMEELPARPQPTPKARQARPRGAAAWDVHEAPTSCYLEFQVGKLRLGYTMRGTTDEEVMSRIREQLPLLQDILEACEARAARRAAEREASHTAQAPQPPALQPLSAPADLQALLQQAVQQALAAQANGQAHGTPPPAAPSTGPAAATGGAPFCHLHQAALELRSNERGSWWSHWVASEKRYCKGEA